MHKKVILPILFTILAINSLLAQKDNNLKTVDINGQIYYEYTVGPAEGFYSISRKFDISKSEIIQYNPDTKDGLKLGQVIRFPKVFKEPAKITTNNNSTIHIVEGGETVYSISKKHNLGIDQIYALNPNSRNGITIGEELNLPEKINQVKTLIPLDTTNQVQNYSVLLENTPYNNSSFQTHTVSPKETIYGLSKTYSISIDDLLKYNPALKTTALQSGMLIRIPKNYEKKSQSANEISPIIVQNQYFFHKVAPKEGLYGISKYYNVPQDTIRLLNPNVNFNELPIGTQVKLPVNSNNSSLIEKPKNYMYYTTEKRVSIKWIAETFNTSTDVLKKLNPGYVKGKINKNVVVRVPLRGDWENASSMNDGDGIPGANLSNIEENEEEFIPTPASITSISEINIAVLLPFMLNDSTLDIPLEKSKDYIEFYSGMLVAVKKLQTQGIKVKLKCYDTNKNSTSVAEILRDPSFKEVNLIIGPAYSSQVSIVSKFAQENQIMTVIPFSYKNKDVAENPYMIQANPHNTFNAVAAKILAKKIYSQNIIVIDPSSDQVGKYSNSFISNLNSELAELNNNPIQTTSIHTIKTAEIKSLNSYLKDDVTNYLILPTSNVAEVSRTLPQIKTALGKITKKDIQLIGFPEWQSMKGLNISELHKYQFITITSLHEDFNNPKTLEFLQSYREEFKTEPTSGYPCYGLYGYDIVNYFSLTINKYGEKFEDYLSEASFDQIGSNFSFKRPTLWGGFVNYGFFMIQYTEDFNINILNKISAQ